MEREPAELRIAQRIRRNVLQVTKPRRGGVLLLRRFDQFNILLEQAVDQFRQGDALGIGAGAEVVLDFLIQIHRFLENRVRVVARVAPISEA